jgi:putative peptidoglycan lipid II flippase
LSSEKIIKNTWLVSGLTMFSRILGLIRDKALVVVFGASAGALDAFFLAFTIPNLFRRLFGEGALSSAFIPEFVNYRENVSKEESDRFASAVFTALTLVLSGFTIIAILACLGGVSAVSDSYNKLALQLTALMLPFMPFICISALLAGMLQSIRRFGLPAAMPVLLNITILAVLGYYVYYVPEQENTIYYVGAAVVAGGVLQVILQFASLRAHGVAVGISLNFSHEGLTKVLQAMGPTILGLAIFQINVLFDRLIAFLLVKESGALTHLYLGNRLVQLPLALFSISLATTAFPDLVSHIKREEWKELFKKIETSIRFLFFLMLPAAIGLMAVGEPIIRMIFQEPDLVFSDLSVYKTSAVLALYAPGLIFISIQQFVTRIFYAEGDYKTPVSISIKMVALNIILNIIFIHVPDFYQRFAYQVSMPLGEAGLALSTSLTSLVSVYWLWAIIKERLCTKETRSLWEESFDGFNNSLITISIASLLMGVISYLIARSIPTEPELFVRLERGLIAVGSGVFIYIMMCHLVPVKEIEEFSFRKKDK